jgi:hypothetical protein
MMTMTRTSEFTAPALLLVFEIADKTWKLGFTIGMGQRLSEKASAGSDNGMTPPQPVAQLNCIVFVGRLHCERRKLMLRVDPDLWCEHQSVGRRA